MSEYIFDTKEFMDYAVERYKKEMMELEKHVKKVKEMYDEEIKSGLVFITLQETNLSQSRKVEIGLARIVKTVVFHDNFVIKKQKGVKR